MALLELYVTFCHFFGTIRVFWAFYAVFSQVRFVVIYAVFGVKYFWLKPCLCKKIVFLHVCKEVQVEEKREIKEKESQTETDTRVCKEESLSYNVHLEENKIICILKKGRLQYRGMGRL